MRAYSFFKSLVPALFLNACADAPSSAPDLAQLDLSAPAPPRQRSVALAADPNGLLWDAAAKTLYIADDDGNQILKWQDEGGISPFAKLPAVPVGGPGLGQLALTADGTLVVTRFGGDVAFVTRDGAVGTVPGLATERRRIGLATAPDGTLFDSFFLKVGTGRVGTVAKLALTGSETDVVTALKKPVGVLVMGADLYVSDQDLGQILKAPLATPGAVAVLAALSGPDLLAAGPGGSLFTGGAQGVRQISAAGEVTAVPAVVKQPRGVAWDAALGRLFIANHDGDPTDGIANTLEIVLVDVK